MTPYNTALQALGVPAGLTLESDGTYEILFVTSSYTADLGNSGDEFEDDIGANIVHREELTSPTWTNRVFDAADFEVDDPGSGTVSQIVLIKSDNGSGGAGGGGTDSTNRLIAHQTLSSPVTFDGVNDSFTFHGSGIFRIGGA